MYDCMTHVQFSQARGYDVIHAALQQLSIEPQQGSAIRQQPRTASSGRVGVSYRVEYCASDSRQWYQWQPREKVFNVCRHDVAICNTSGGKVRRDDCSTDTK